MFETRLQLSLLEDGVFLPEDALSLCHVLGKAVLDLLDERRQPLDVQERPRRAWHPPACDHAFDLFYAFKDRHLKPSRCNSSPVVPRAHHRAPGAFSFLISNGST